MNKKGLTLVEMIAALVVLSIVALIVTPNLYGNIRDYKNKLYNDQLNNIKQAGKNWAADNVDSIPVGEYSLMVYLSELQNNGYIDENLTNPNGGVFSENTFVLIKCEVIHDENNVYADNYKYTYGAYETIIEYEKDMAIEYMKRGYKDNNDTLTITVSDLKDKGYIDTDIRDLDGKIISVEENNIQVTRKYVDGDFEYSAVIL